MTEYDATEQAYRNGLYDAKKGSVADGLRIALQILENIGGCDADDEWSKGYDAAIDTAYQLIEKEIAKHEK